jgi:drug/metabolite transporter (DMT)-like permease
VTGVSSSSWFPVFTVAFAAAAWGLFWLPLRFFEQSGLSPGWVTVSQFAVPAGLLSPLALWRCVGGRRSGARLAMTGLFTGGAVALYADSVLLTEVARALILFYVAPVWSTLLEITVMGQRLTRPRVMALVLGLAGLVIILGGHSGVPLPRNLGDALALMAGMVFALGTLQVRRAQDAETFENVFAFFLYGSVVALVMALLPVAGMAALPSWAVLRPVLPWLVVAAVGFLIPVTWGLLWGSARMDPGRLAILLQLEAVIGIASAALLTAEPFGPVELLGTLLVIGAGVVDVLGGRTGKAAAAHRLPATPRKP